MLECAMKLPPPSRFALVLAGSALAIACGSSASTSSLPSLDFAPAKGGATFNPDEIIAESAFTDGLAYGPRDLEMFLSLTPYGAASFLATYQSSGVLAQDAIAAAATKYSINPIFFLVRAEVVAGLIAAKTYPLPARQVEYVFGCGCTSPSTCDASFAGLDKQADCLGSTLRTSLDEIAATGRTAGGWGPGVASVTLDGVRVTPADASTAALYEYDPIVGTGKSDNWLVWNIWQLYARALPPPASGLGATPQIGDPCAAAADCGFANPVCETGATYPDGLCTSKCNGSCAGTDAFCANFSGSGYCLAICNPTDPASCRAGYSCALIQQFGGPSPTMSANVCAPM